MAAPKKLDDTFGSRWITAGAGSVVLLWGEPGDPIVEWKHLKQPLEEVGPFSLLHDHDRGLPRLHEAVDLADLLMATANGLTVPAAAVHIFGTASPTRSQNEKARRRLEALVRRGIARRIDSPTPDPARYVRIGA